MVYSRGRMIRHCVSCHCSVVLVGWLVGWLVDWLAGLLVGWLVGVRAACMADRRGKNDKTLLVLSLLCRRGAGWLAGWMVGVQAVG